MKTNKTVLFPTKRPALLDFDTDLENVWLGVTVTRKAESGVSTPLRKTSGAKHYHVTFERYSMIPVQLTFRNQLIVVGTMTGVQSRKIHMELEWALSLVDPGR